MFFQTQTDSNSGGLINTNASFLDMVTVNSGALPAGTPVELQVNFTLQSSAWAYWQAFDGTIGTGSYCNGVLGPYTCFSVGNDSNLVIADPLSGVVIASETLSDNGVFSLQTNSPHYAVGGMQFFINIGESFSLSQSLHQYLFAAIDGSANDLAVLEVETYAVDPVTIQVLTPGAFYTTQSGSRYGPGGLPPTSVPEPGTLVLLGIGIAGLAWRRRMHCGR